MAFLRFVVSERDEDSGRRQGPFQAMLELATRAALFDHEQRAYDEVYEWFRHNLKKPDRFSRSSKPHARGVAISWFKDTATEHIRRMRSICLILEAHEISVEVIFTDRPGYIVYEDAFQVAAEPYSETVA
jgi:hypothetical protein